MSEERHLIRLTADVLSSDVAGRSLKQSCALGGFVGNSHSKPFDTRKKMLSV